MPRSNTISMLTRAVQNLCERVYIHVHVYVFCSHIQVIHVNMCLCVSEEPYRYSAVYTKVYST